MGDGFMWVKVFSFVLVSYFETYSLYKNTSTLFCGLITSMVESFKLETKNLKGTIRPALARTSNREFIICISISEVL